MLCPCRDCSKREINCHSNCKAYLDYADYKRQVREAEQKDKRFRYKLKTKRR